MFAELATLNWLRPNASKIAHSYATEVLGFGSEDATESAAVIEAGAGILEGASAKKVTNGLLASLTRSAAMHFGSHLGPLGPLATQMLGFFVRSSGMLAEQASEGLGVADKTNQSIAAAKDAAVQGIDLGKDIKQQVAQTLGTGLGNSLQTAIADATGVKLPSVVTPLIQQVTQNIANKV